MRVDDDLDLEYTLIINTKSNRTKTNYRIEEICKKTFDKKT